MTYCESVTPFRVHFVSQHGEKYPTVESSLSSSTNFIATHFFNTSGPLNQYLTGKIRVSQLGNSGHAVRGNTADQPLYMYGELLFGVHRV